MTITMVMFKSAKDVGHKSGYIISDESMDGTFLSFREAYDRVDFAHFGTLLTDESATKMFFKTEQIQGYAPRFVGVCEFVER